MLTLCVVSLHLEKHAAGVIKLCSPAEQPIDACKEETWEAVSGEGGEGGGGGGGAGACAIGYHSAILTSQAL